MHMQSATATGMLPQGLPFQCLPARWAVALEEAKVYRVAQQLELCCALQRHAILGRPCGALPGHRTALA